MIWAITKRKLNKAIKLAREDGKFDSRLTDDKAQTVIFYKEPALFWPAGSCNNNEAQLAYIRTRSNGTIYVAYAAPCGANIPVERFEVKS